MLIESVNLFAVCCYLDAINAKRAVGIVERLSYFKNTMFDVSGGFGTEGSSVEGSGILLHVALIRNI